MLSLWESNQSLIEKLFKDEQNARSWSTFNPAANISETPESFFVQMDIPGTKKEEIQIQLEDGFLTISGDRNLLRRENEKFLNSERWNGKFQRVFRIATGVKSDLIKASYLNGVLEVEIPKAEEGKKKTISVN